MLRTFVNGKIHQLKVTGLQPGYNGSCLICPELLAAAGIEPFEKVEIYSLTSTARIATYVFPGAAEGEFTLNGGAALHFRLGDRVAVVAYRQEETFSGANCVIVVPLDNSIAETLRYKTADDALVRQVNVLEDRRSHANRPTNGTTFGGLETGMETLVRIKVGPKRCSARRGRIRLKGERNE